MTRSQKSEHAEKIPKKQHAGPTAFQPEVVEQDVLRVWEAEKTFEESLKQRASAPRYSFYDGPPYATGSPHYGHILQTAIKDTVTRYWTMRGFFVPRRVGWDCHGLPVENLVEKELSIKHKKEIEERGIEAFNAACRSAVLRRVDDWTTLLRRVGRWADYAHAYKTMDASFIESAWWVFRMAWDRGLITRGMRSSPYCPHCETPLSHHETVQGYREVEDPAITVKLPLVGEERMFLLVWTTTPWTLPANAAVAVHPDISYVRIRVGDERWILAKDRLEAMVRDPYEIEEDMPGSSLVGRTYTPLFTFLSVEKPAFRVVAGAFVSATEGTGLVHIAPAFGEEDFRLAQQEDLPLLQTIDDRGRFISAVTPWAGVFVKDADAAIIDDLQQRRLLARSETIRHEYPFCWRCETPLIYRATHSWFIAVTTIKDQLLQNAEQISWIPAHLKSGRFGQGLRDAPDWAVSRSRYWGIPLPVWECASCKTPTVVGSIADLEAAGGNRDALRSEHAEVDLHRPYVDRVVLRCASCGGEAHRVPEVLDVWFDSGSMPYGQWHYPFENKELVESTFPADFIGESLEMTRGWFYTLHVLAGIVTLQDVGLGKGKPAFKNVVASGLILAEDGRKLSKRFGNYPDPAGVIEKYGADTLRLYLLTATSFGEDMRFSDRLVGELYKKFTLILWNVWQYYRTYVGSGQEAVGSGGQPSLLDRWILARVAQLATDMREAMEQYRIDDAARQLQPFVDDLSTWYVRRSRGRAEALPVLREVLRRFSLVAAPFVPFLAEHIHRELVGTSPHLADWLENNASDAAVLEQTQSIRELASAGQRARAEAKIKVRQPLAEVVVVGAFSPLEVAGEEGLALLRDELNVQRVILSAAKDLGSGDSSSPSAPQNDTKGRYVWVEVPGGKIGLNTELTPKLRQEGIIRDLIRQVQELRKQAGYQFDDQIVLSVETENSDIQKAIEEFRPLLREETKSETVQFQRGLVDAEATTSIGDASVWLGVRRGG
ncbi:MAG: isoleucine--tRNA ligase [bacterium]|nr:isoleucine--tRNA ligase [bacterium]